MPSTSHTLLRSAPQTPTCISLLIKTRYKQICWDNRSPLLLAASLLHLSSIARAMPMQQLQSIWSYSVSLLINFISMLSIENLLCHHNAPLVSAMDYSIQSLANIPFKAAAFLYTSCLGQSVHALVASLVMVNCKHAHAWWLSEVATCWSLKLTARLLEPTPHQQASTFQLLLCLLMGDCSMHCLLFQGFPAGNVRKQLHAQYLTSSDNKMLSWYQIELGLQAVHIGYIELTW